MAITPEEGLITLRELLDDKNRQIERLQKRLKQAEDRVQELTEHLRVRRASE